MTDKTSFARARAQRLALSLWLWLGSSLLPGCDESGPRIYAAQPYRALLDCLETYVPLSLVEARDVGALCDPVCLRLGASLYVSTVCAPYPSETTLVPPEDEECAAALLAPSCAELPPDAGEP
jgi:hypothetical protein